MTSYQLGDLVAVRGTRSNSRRGNAVGTITARHDNGTYDVEAGVYGNGLVTLTAVKAASLRPVHDA